MHAQITCGTLVYSVARLLCSLTIVGLNLLTALCVTALNYLLAQHLLAAQIQTLSIINVNK